MINWIPVTGSSRIIAMAYDTESATIYVRFPNEIEWRYECCSELEWEEFSAPGTSKGAYISERLNQHPHGRHLP